MVQYLNALGQGQGQEKAEGVNSNRIVEYSGFCL